MQKKGKILVTGGSGKVGRWIVRHLIESGYEVVNVDTRRPDEALCQTIAADLTQLGQVVTAFSPFGTLSREPYVGVIHMAAIPRAHEQPNDEVFRVNALSTYNVLEACAILGIKKAVIASSESSYGLCFASDFFEPRYLPVDEDHPQLPEDSYGLSKVVNEVTAAAFHRRTGMQVVSLRIGNVLSPEDHAPVRATYSDPTKRLRNLWSYIDVRDLAAACRLSIERDGHRPREHLEASLRRGVIGYRWAAHFAHDRAGVDDFSPASLDHPRSHGPRDQEGARQVRLDHLAPAFLRHRRQR